MSRPVIDPTTIESGLVGWDALIRDVIAALVSAPLPIKEYANLAAFPTASSYDRCLAMAVDTNDMYMAVAGTWKKITRAA